MTHTIKIPECYADAIIDGRKTFEVRFNDRGYNAGDKVIFKLDTLFSSHPLDEKVYQITYVHSGLGLEKGYVVFGIKEVRDDMTLEEIENIPKNVNVLLDSSVLMPTRQKLDEKLNKVCELAIKALEQEPKTGHCKDCKYFEYDSVAKIDGIPLILAHEICSKWGDGCKTKEDGYCFMFERKMEDL